ncbi:MAG: beta-propeller domain-containing protein, partial [Deltaproteobacteria bacterium]|nr:beta-propeller domain-containing protein [Deltaproteobacteria bacterium]
MKTWTKRWWSWAAAGTLGLLGAGCGNPIPDPPAVTKRAMLQSFQGQSACQDLEKYLEDTAVLQMRTELESARDGVPSWGWWGGFRGGPMFGMADANAATPTAGAGQSGGSETKSAPTDYTTTNNQVAGVDEADFVKNDGTRIFTLSGQNLFAAKSWPADQTQVKGSLKIDGWPREMFLDGTDKVVVFSSVYDWYPLSNSRGAYCWSMYCGYYYSNTVKVTVVDVTDLSNLKATQEFYLPGSYNSARKVGSSVRLVISDGFNFPQTVQWYPSNVTDWNDKSALKKAYDDLIVANEKEIRAQTLAEWVPAAKLIENGKTTTLPHACGDFAKVNAPTRLGTVSVVTLDLTHPDTIGRNSIIAEPGEIYASEKNLYVATRHWWWWPAPGQKDTTYFHKFDISQPDQAHYVASGTVEGYINDQFSMDENAAGFFRVATTIQTRVADLSNPMNWWGRLETTNKVSVLGENNGSLDVVGQSAEFTKGERIMSARFVGDKGFVVTFRQVDPLVTFDMTDPTKPTKIGELTIPGFSTYIHPIDANHLLTIGEYVPPPGPNGQTDWRARALQ